MDNKFQKIKINDTEYYIVDSIQNFKAEDSFITPFNKLKKYNGKGEARKYVGDYKNNSMERISNFFNFNSWTDTKDFNTNERKYLDIQNRTCFFTKSNLIDYLNDAKITTIAYRASNLVKREHYNNY